MPGLMFFQGGLCLGVGGFSPGALCNEVSVEEGLCLGISVPRGVSARGRGLCQ